MIKKHTVLVLGAGASVPYGFPTGHELKWQIIGAAHNRQVQPYQDIRRAIAACKVNEDTLKEFGRALQHSGSRSVDDFLEYRMDFLDVGKIAIASALVRCEKLARLFPQDGDLYQRIFAALKAPRDHWQENKLTVVTFNYDRSLDHYCTTALAHAFKLDPLEALAVFRSAVQVIHVYGALGAYPAQRGYDVSNESAAIRVASDGIKILHEKSTLQDTAFDDARVALSRAGRIYFLGFGFLAQNVTRLLDGVEFARDAGIYASRYGMTDEEMRAAKKMFFKQATHFDESRDRDALAALREMPALDQ